MVSLSCISTTVIKRQKEKEKRETKTGIYKAPSFSLEHADVITDSLLLVLRNTFGNPCDVANFLGVGQRRDTKQEREK